VNMRIFKVIIRIYKIRSSNKCRYKGRIESTWAIILKEAVVKL
jgi:hypothetical protein